VNLLDHITKPCRLRLSIRAYFALLVLVVMLPVLATTWWLTSGSAETERRQLEQDAQTETREITAAIHREIIGLQNTMTVLAASVHLKEGDFAGFHRIATNAARMLDATIMLRDLRTDEQVVNTAFPWGTSLADKISPPRDAFEQELLRGGKVAISNVFVGKLTQRPVVRITVPVIHDGSVDFLLSVAIPLKPFAEILGTLKIGTGQLATVIDRNNTIVTRSRRNEAFAGTPLAIPMAEWRSVSRSVNREGIAFHWFNHRSDLTGWIVSVGVPDSVLDAPGRRALVYFAAAGGLAFLLALALSYPLASRLAETSGALGIDRTPTREEFKVLFESAPNGVLVADEAGRIILLNAQLERKFGYRRDELIGQPVEVLIPERFRGAHAKLRGSYIGAAAARAMGGERELFGLRKDGTEFPIEVGLNPIKASGGILVMTTVVDITARKSAADRLTAALTERDDLRRRFLRAQEEERLRLAHELHDQTGQGLTAAMIELKGLEAHMRETDRDRLRLLRLQLEGLGQTLHHVAWELRPASIDELGLASALSEYVSVWSTQYAVEADFHCDDHWIHELTDEVRTTIYRVVQEGLTNIAKHAPEATSVSVVVERVENTVRVIIEDNGRGFDPGALPGMARDRGGLGLAGMRERLALLGGEIEIESSAGAGTTIFARIPLPPDRMVA
jgi:PAS domain S-box-containing protein